MDLLEELKLYDYGVMFLGLIFNVLLIIFVVIAILLVFSLLLISIETKAFEYGVMRLVGLTKKGFVAMILTQAFMFVFPAVILAFVCSFPLIHLIYAKMIADQLGYMPSIVPSGMAISQALFIGLVIPLVSSIVPIKRSLAKNLSETLDVWRGKNKGTTVKTTDSKVI